MKSHASAATVVGAALLSAAAAVSQTPTTPGRAMKGTLIETTVASANVPSPAPRRGEANAVPITYYLPKNYDAKRAERYPLLIQLHSGGGAICRARSKAKLTWRGQLRSVEDDPQRTIARCCAEKTSALSRHPESCGIGRDYGKLAMWNIGRYPVIGYGLRSIDVIRRNHLASKRVAAKIGANVFPYNFARWSNLEKSAIHAFIHKRVAVRQPASVANERAMEAPRGLIRVNAGILPNDLLFKGIDLKHA
jgi:hypothetical protein